MQAILGPYNNHDHHTLCCASLAVGSQERRKCRQRFNALKKKYLNPEAFTRLQKMRSDGNYK